MSAFEVTSGPLESDPIRVVIPAFVWSRIVFAAQESDDWQLRALIEQAVSEAQTYVASNTEKSP